MIKTHLISVPSYTRMKEEDEYISSLDPLELDQLLTKDIPRLNTQREKDKLRYVVRELKLESGGLGEFNIFQARAAIRDVSMIAGSLVRFGYKIRDFPNIEEILLNCSKKTQEVPSDTVYTYGSRNPLGKRMRRFTTHSQEEIFIGSLKTGMDVVPFSVYHLMESQRRGLDDAQSADLIEASSDYFHKMLRSMRDVFRLLSPKFFTEEIRPFFDPRIIGGTKYLAGGGAQMPIIFLDQILWGAECEDQIYKNYFGENLSYQPPLFRGLVEDISSYPTLKEQLKRKLMAGEILPEKVSDSLLRLIDNLKRFRKPHLKVAEKNMEIRAEGSKGSGGYRSEILAYLLSKTEELGETISKFKLIEYGKNN